MTAKKSTITLNKLGNKLLKRGQSFSVLVTKPGSIGDQITLKVKRYGRKDKDLVKAAGRPFTITHACVPAGARKAAKTCPARPSPEHFLRAALRLLA